jgi:hypothetical protein
VGEEDKKVQHKTEIYKKETTSNRWQGRDRGLTGMVKGRKGVYDEGQGNHRGQRPQAGEGKGEEDREEGDHGGEIGSHREDKED